MNAQIALLTLELYLPESRTLKDKRAVVKSIQKRVRNVFNVAVAEVDYLDKWQRTTLAITTVSNSSSHAVETLQHVCRWLAVEYPHIEILNTPIDVR